MTRVLNDQVSFAVFCLNRPAVHTCVSTYLKHFMRQLLPSGESGFAFLLERCAQQFLSETLVYIFPSIVV